MIGYHIIYFLFFHILKFSGKFAEPARRTPGYAVRAWDHAVAAGCLALGLNQQKLIFEFFLRFVLYMERNCRILSCRNPF